MPETIRVLGISEVTYYRWRKEYGGMNVSQAKGTRCREHEAAPSRLTPHTGQDDPEGGPPGETSEPLASAHVRRGDTRGATDIGAPYLQGARPMPVHTATPATPPRRRGRADRGDRRLGPASAATVIGASPICSRWPAGRSTPRESSASGGPRASKCLPGSPSAGGCGSPTSRVSGFGPSTATTSGP